MKKLVFIVALLTGFLFSFPDMPKSQIINDNISEARMVYDGEWFEIVFINGVWYKITYNADGSIKITQILTEIDD